MRLPLFRAARAKTTSADVQAEADRHATLLSEARSELAGLDAARQEVLVGDEVAAIRDHETRSSELRLTVARLEARLQALADQAREVAAAEAAAALTARRSAAEARAAEIEVWFRKAYPDMARVIVSALHEVQAIDREIEAVNRSLGEADRHDEVLRGAEDRVNPVTWARDDDGKPFHCEGALSLLDNTKLLALETIGAPGWGRPLGVPRF